MKIFKLFIVITLCFLATKIVLAYQFDQQINKIVKNPKNSNQCYAISTSKFSFSETMEKEYLYYICKLNPDIKSFAFYYDIDNEKIANQILLSTSFDSLQLASPLYCSEQFDQIEDKVYQRCNVFIAYDGYGDIHSFGRYEYIFSTPSTLVIDPDTIEEYFELMPK